MSYLPVALDIRLRHCLVVGGGQTALRKCRLLHERGARAIHVVAPQVCDDLAALIATSPAHRLIRRVYESGDVASEPAPGLVIAATDDAATNRRVHDDAVLRHIPVNVVDDPALCTFIFPAIIDRAPLSIAISSEAQAPFVSRYLRASLEASVPPNVGKLAQFQSSHRNRVRERFPDPVRRRHFWEAVFASSVPAALLADDDAAAQREFDQLLDGAQPERRGEVFLVGAGPGDPDLLTLKALRLMQEADVVLHDRLVSPAVLALVRRDARRIDAGKRRADHTLPQPDINAQLVALARNGYKVLRLKGGDPFIFGRGGEEMEALVEAGIPFRIVPGITAASGCAAAAGIPLTHRDHAHSVRFLTGHPRDDGDEIDWRDLADAKQTLVFYMGLTGLPRICANLVTKSGRSPATPAALVEKGTTAHQRVLVSTLAGLPDLIARERVRAPTLTIVGDVVRLHPDWNLANHSA